MAHQPPEILVFKLGGRRFGLPAAEVRELVRVVTIVPLPQAPPIVEGVVDLRGHVIPVLDLRERLRLPARPPEISDHLIVARTRGRWVALRVDHALELIVPPASDGKPDRDTSVDAEAAIGVTAVAKLPDGLVPILDLRAFFAQAESDTLRAVLPASGTSPAEEGRP